MHIDMKKRTTIALTAIAALGLLACVRLYPRHRASGTIVQPVAALAVARSFTGSAATFRFSDLHGMPLKGRPRPSFQFFLDNADVSVFVSSQSISVVFNDIPQRAFYGADYRRLESRPVSMPEGRLLEIATKYMKVHYPDPQILHLIRSDTWKAENSYSGGLHPVPHNFVFGEAIPGLSFTPNECWIQVESFTGRLTAYEGKHYGILVPTNPTISINTAMHNAIHTLVKDGHKGILRRMGVTDPDSASRTEHLVYILTITGKGPERNSYPESQDFNYFLKPLPALWPLLFKRQSNLYTVIVDAHTGEVLAWSFGDIFAPGSHAWAAKINRDHVFD